MSKTSKELEGMESRLKAFDIPYDEDFFSGCPIPGNPSHPWYKHLSRVFGISIILLSLAVVSAITILVLMIKPILNHKGYFETNCTVTHSGIFKSQNCSCGFNCTSLLPCGRVHVSYPLVDNTSNIITETILHEDQLNARYYPLCSISSSAACYKVSKHNRRDVEDFVNNTGRIGNVIPCLYCSWDVRRVVLRILPPQGDIATLLGVSWGCVLLFLILLIVVGMVLSTKPYKHLKQPLANSPRLIHHSIGPNEEDLHSHVTFSNVS